MGTRRPPPVEGPEQLAASPAMASRGSPGNFGMGGEVNVKPCGCPGNLAERKAIRE